MWIVYDRRLTPGWKCCDLQIENICVLDLLHALTPPAEIRDRYARRETRLAQRRGFLAGRWSSLSRAMSLQGTEKLDAGNAAAPCLVRTRCTDRILRGPRRILRQFVPCGDGIRLAARGLPPSSARCRVAKIRGCLPRSRSPAEQQKGLKYRPKRFGNYTHPAA